MAREYSKNVFHLLSSEYNNSPHTDNYANDYIISHNDNAQIKFIPKNVHGKQILLRANGNTTITT